MSEHDAVIDTQLDAVDEALRSGTAAAPGDAERELQELALALAAESPKPNPDFAANLGERVRAGFERPARLAWLPRLSVPKLAGLGAAASALVAVAVAAALIPGGGDDETISALGERRDVPDLAPQSGDGDDAGGVERSIAPGEPPVPGGNFAPRRGERAVERTASLTLAAPADRLDRVADQIVTLTDRHDGFVLRSSVAAGEEGTTGGNFELRIPEARLQAALRDLSRLGEVRARSQSGEDVTSQVVSAADRLQAARADRRGLLRRLESADTDTQADALRRQLDLNAREISGLRLSLRDLRLRTDYATVSLELEEDQDAGSDLGTGSDDDGLRGAADDALATLSGSLELAVRALGAVIPLGLLLALGWLGSRTLRRRRREAALT